MAAHEGAPGTSRHDPTRRYANTIDRVLFAVIVAVFGVPLVADFATLTEVHAEDYAAAAMFAILLGVSLRGAFGRHLSVGKESVVITGFILDWSVPAALVAELDVHSRSYPRLRLTTGRSIGVSALAFSNADTGFGGRSRNDGIAGRVAAVADAARAREDGQQQVVVRLSRGLLLIPAAFLLLAGSLAYAQLT